MKENETVVSTDFKSALNDKKLFIETYGCQMNVADSEVVASIMQMDGFELTDKITDAEFSTFIANNGIGYTDEQKKAAINTQAWILHLTNPAESWANVRRSGYPRLKSPAEYDFAQFLTGGADIPVRLSYPVLESSYNKQSYEEALNRMGGENSWNTPLWWDVN